MKTTYWNGNGKYQQFVDHLNIMIPVSGSVILPTKNKKLERYRKANNCYYDLYVNGLCNRARSFARLFGFGSFHYKRKNSSKFEQQLYELTEEKMDEIVLAAAKEQGLCE
jgi:hypothetical protein